MRKENELQIARRLGTGFRTHFGKGPQTIHVTYMPPFITMHLQGFLAPMEEILLHQNQHTQLEQLRKQMMIKVLPIIQQIIEEETSETVQEFYYDWNVRQTEKCTGMIWGLFDASQHQKESFFWPSELNKAMFQQQLTDFSKKAQKEPKETNLFWLHDRLLVVERKGVFVEIEKAFIKQGYIETLKGIKRPLEKQPSVKYVLENLLQRSIQEAFVDWNFPEDKEYLFLSLEKPKE